MKVNLKLRLKTPLSSKAKLENVIVQNNSQIIELLEMLLCKEYAKKYIVKFISKSIIFYFILGELRLQNVE